MATKKIVPRATNEGGIGTAVKVWGDSYFMDLYLGLTSSANVRNIKSAAISNTANGAPLSIFGGDTTGTNYAGGYLNLYPGKGTGSGGGVSSGIALWSSYQGASGSTLQGYVKNTLFYTLGTTTSQRQFNPADPTDYYEVSVGASGATTISTVDSGGTIANLVYNVDGTITHNAAGEVHYWTGGGAAEMNVSLDGLTINTIGTDAALTSFLVETGGLIRKRPLSGIPAGLTAVTDTNDAACYVALWPDASGNLTAHTDVVFKYTAGNTPVLYTPNFIVGNTNTAANATDLTITPEAAVNGGPTNAVGGFSILKGSSGTGSGAGGGVQCWGTRNTISGTSGHTAGRIAYFENLAATTSDVTIWDPASVSATDYFRISTTANGATTLGTVDVAGAAAHLVLDSDGDTSFKKTGTTLATVESLRIESFLIALSDETSLLTVGTNKAKMRMPYAFTVTEVRASLSIAATGASLITVDINEGGSTMLTTKLTIDASETTSTTAATAAVIGGAGPALADDAEITFDIDVVGNTTAGKGLKVYIIGYKTV